MHSLTDLRPSMPADKPTRDPQATVRLLRAYLDAHYRVWTPAGALRLVVGRPAPRLERFHPGMRRFAVITACNPRSTRLTAAANLARDLALLGDLRALGLTRIPAENAAPTGDFREPAWLVAGIDLPALDALARRHDQNAVLAWRRGETVRLRCCAGGFPGLTRVMDTPFCDWVACADPDADR